MPGEITDKVGKVHEYDDQYLLDAGFERDDSERDAHQSVSDAASMDQGGQYFVRGVYKKGKVTITFENNASEITQGGLTSQVQHPQACIIEGPGGRVACHSNDTDLQLQLAEEMS